MLVHRNEDVKGRGQRTDAHGSMNSTVYKPSSFPPYSEQLLASTTITRLRRLQSQSTHSPSHRCQIIETLNIPPGLESRPQQLVVGSICTPRQLQATFPHHGSLETPSSGYELLVACHVSNSNTTSVFRIYNTMRHARHENCVPIHLYGPIQFDSAVCLCFVPVSLYLNNTHSNE